VGRKRQLWLGGRIVVKGQGGSRSWGGGGGAAGRARAPGATGRPVATSTIFISMLGTRRPMDEYFVDPNGGGGTPRREGGRGAFVCPQCVQMLVTQREKKERIFSPTQNPCGRFLGPQGGGGVLLVSGGWRGRGRW